MEPAIWLHGVANVGGGKAAGAQDGCRPPIACASVPFSIASQGSKKMTRRIVTANNAEGRSYFVSDTEVGEAYLWESAAAAPLGAEPGGGPTYRLPTTAPAIDPPPGGTKCVRFAMEPWAIMQRTMAENGFPGLDPDGFHRTASIDYIMILSGEVDLILDEGRTTVRAGDLVVQRNTNHAWHNMTDQPTEFWGVLVWAPTE